MPGVLSLRRLRQDRSECETAWSTEWGLQDKDPFSGQQKNIACSLPNLEDLLASADLRFPGVIYGVPRQLPQILNGFHPKVEPSVDFALKNFDSLSMVAQGSPASCYDPSTNAIQLRPTGCHLLGACALPGCHMLAPHIPQNTFFSGFQIKILQFSEYLKQCKELHCFRQFFSEWGRFPALRTHSVITINERKDF